MGITEWAGERVARRKLAKLDLPSVTWRKKRFAVAAGAVVVGLLSVFAGESEIAQFLKENWEAAAIVGAGLYGVAHASGSAKQERMLHRARTEAIVGMVELKNRGRGTVVAPADSYLTQAEKELGGK